MGKSCWLASLANQQLFPIQIFLPFPIFFLAPTAAFGSQPQTHNFLFLFHFNLHSTTRVCNYSSLIPQFSQLLHSPHDTVPSHSHTVLHTHHHTFPLPYLKNNHKHKQHLQHWDPNTHKKIINIMNSKNHTCSLLFFFSERVYSLIFQRIQSYNWIV